MPRLRKDFGYDAHGRGHESASAKGLQQAEKYQHLDVFGNSAHRRRDDEQHQTNYKGRLSAEHVAYLAYYGHRNGKAQLVNAYDPAGNCERHHKIRRNYGKSHGDGRSADRRKHQSHAYRRKYHVVQFDTPPLIKKQTAPFGRKPFKAVTQLLLL